MKKFNKYYVVPLFFNFMMLAEKPLFKKYRGLKKISYKPLGSFPTPIERLPYLEKGTPHKIYIKQDNLSGKQLKNKNKLFGGNKVRKLEFVLAHALKEGADGIVTYGSAGSNHVVATSVYGHLAQLPVYAVLKPQPNSDIVQRNRALMKSFNATLIEAGDTQDRDAKGKKLIKEFKDNDKYLYEIPLGASNALGTVGFVNAVFELKDQIRKGIMPEPDCIILPVGSGGSTAGLILGCKIAGMKTKILPVAVEAQGKKLLPVIDSLIKETNQYLHALDKKIELYDWNNYTIDLITQFSGAQYGQVTRAARDAMALAQEHEIMLDGTYSGKAMAALMDYIKKEKEPKTILFWNTFSDKA